MPGRPTILTLPFPPSVNSYWRHNRGRTHISSEGKAYRQQVAQHVAVAAQPQQGQARLSVYVEVYPPDKRRRDLDNMFKAVLDALAHAGVYEDDSQIDKLSIERRPVRTAGQLVVIVRPL